MRGEFVFVGGGDENLHVATEFIKLPADVSDSLVKWEENTPYVSQRAPRTRKLIHIQLKILAKKKKSHQLKILGFFFIYFLTVRKSC